MGIFTKKTAEPIRVSMPQERFDKGCYVGLSKVIVVVKGNCTERPLVNNSFNPPRARGGMVSFMNYISDSDQTVIEYTFRNGYLTHRDEYADKFARKMFNSIKNKEVYPVSVSGCDPIYERHDKKYNIIGWTVKVTLQGKDSVCQLFWPTAKKGVPSYVRTADYEKTGIVEAEYKFKDGLFGHGAERAWQFRIKMLAQITKNNRHLNEK